MAPGNSHAPGARLRETRTRRVQRQPKLGLGEYSSTRSKPATSSFHGGSTALIVGDEVILRNHTGSKESGGLSSPESGLDPTELRAATA